MVKAESDTTAGEEVKVEEVSFRQPADGIVYTVVHPIVTGAYVPPAPVKDTTEEEAEVKQAEVGKEEEKAEGVTPQQTEVDDVTDRERILSHELNISVAELRAMDKQYDEEREAGIQRHTARRQRQAAVDVEEDGYASSSSRSSSDDDSSADDFYESYSSVTTAVYPHIHITPYPAISSRVGLTYQAYPIPDVLPSDEAKAAECALHVTEEGELVVLSEEEAERRAPDGDLYWGVQTLRRRRQEMREEVARKQLEQQAAEAAAAAAAPHSSTEVVPQPVVGVAVSVEEHVRNLPTAKRSQRSSAQRAREFIASVAASTESDNGAEVALALANEVRQVVDAVVDAVAVAGVTDPGGGGGVVDTISIVLS